MTAEAPKQWQIAIPKTPGGQRCLTHGFMTALAQVIEALGNAAPDALDEARAATLLAIRTNVTEGISIEDEAAGYRAALATVEALFEREKRRLGNPDD